MVVQSPVPKAPKPTKICFDPYNSSSTGHQVDKCLLSGTASWRDSRTYKLAHQFKDTSGRGGSQHLSDLVGAGSKDWRKDGRKDNGDLVADAPVLRPSGWQDIRGIMGGSRKRKSDCLESDNPVKTDVNPTIPILEKSQNATTTPSERDEKLEAVSETTTIRHPQIFRGLTIYLNGSTAPLVSDHKLKQLFFQHGGNASIALGRRTVTHVILGKTCGGGLASSKIQKEVATVGGKGIKYVTAQWVMDSVERGIRQPEGRYIPAEIGTRIGGSKQASVASMFTGKPQRGKS